MFVDLPNVIGIALDERDNPAIARAVLKGGQLILAGPAGPKLNRKTIPIIRSAVARILANREDDPRVVIVTSVADIPWDTPGKIFRPSWMPCVYPVRHDESEDRVDRMRSLCPGISID